MRVLLCTSGGYPGNAVLDALRASRALEIVGVVRSTRVLSPRYGLLRGAWEQYRRSGMRYAAYLGCMLLKSLPGFPTRDVNAADARAFIAGLAPDLIITAFFNQRLLTQVPALNIHPSLLPALKGVDPVFYARLRGLPLGVSVHRVSPELDAGDLVAQESAQAAPGESVLATTVRLYARGAQLLIDSLGRPGRPQSGPGSYDSWPVRSDVAALRRRGVSLVRLSDLRARAA